MPEPVTPEGSVPQSADHETKQITPQTSEKAQQDPGTAEIERPTPAEELAEELTTGDATPREKLRQVAGESEDEQAQQRDQSEGSEEPELSPAEKLNASIQEEIDQQIEEEKGSLYRFKSEKTRRAEDATIASAVTTPYLNMARDLTGLPVDDVDGIGPAFEAFLKDHSEEDLRARVAKIPPEDQYAHGDTRANLEALRDRQLALIDKVVGAGIGQAESGQKGTTSITEEKPEAASPSPEDSGRDETERQMPEGYYTPMRAHIESLLEGSDKPDEALETYQKYLAGELTIDSLQRYLDAPTHRFLRDRLPITFDQDKISNFDKPMAKDFNHDKENSSEYPRFDYHKKAFLETQKAVAEGRQLTADEIADHQKVFDDIMRTTPEELKNVKFDWVNFNRIRLGLPPERKSHLKEDAFVLAFPQDEAPISYGEFSHREYQVNEASFISSFESTEAPTSAPLPENPVTPESGTPEAQESEKPKPSQEFFTPVLSMVESLINETGDTEANRQYKRYIKGDGQLFEVIQFLDKSKHRVLLDLLPGTLSAHMKHVDGYNDEYRDVLVRNTFNQGENEAKKDWITTLDKTGKKIAAGEELTVAEKISNKQLYAEVAYDPYAQQIEGYLDYTRDRLGLTQLDLETEFKLENNEKAESIDIDNTISLKEAASRLNSMIARIVYRNNPDMLKENEKNETTINTGRRKKFIEALHAEIPELKTIGKGLVSKNTEERPEEQQNTDKQGGFLSGFLKRFGIGREEPQNNPDLKPGAKPLPEYSGKQYHTSEDGEEGEDMNPEIRGHSEEEHDAFEDFVRNDLDGQISPIEDFIAVKAYDAYDESKFEYSYNRNYGIENEDPDDNTVNKDGLYRFRLSAARFKVEKDYIKEKLLSYVPQSKTGQRAVLAGASLYLAGLTYLKMRNAGVFDQLEQSARDFMDNLPARTVPGVGIPAPEIAAQETASAEAPQTETVPTPSEAAPAAPESTLPGTTNEDIGGPPVEGGNNLSVDENYYNVPLELTQDFGFMVDIPKNANPAEIQQQIATASEFYAEQTGIPVQEARAQVVQELQSTFNDAGIAIDVTPETNEAAQPPTEATESPEGELPLEVSYDQEYNVYEIPVEKGEFGGVLYLSPEDPIGASSEYLDGLTEMYIQDTGGVDSNDQAAVAAVRQELVQNIQQEITSSSTLTPQQKEQLQQVLSEAANYVPEVTFDAENNSFTLPYDENRFHAVLTVSPNESPADVRGRIDTIVKEFQEETNSTDLTDEGVGIIREDVIQDMQQLVTSSDTLNQQQKDQLQQILSEAAAYTPPTETTPSATPTTEAPVPTTSAPSETPGTTAPDVPSPTTTPSGSVAPSTTPTSEPAPTTTPAPTETLESAAPGAPTTEPGTTQTEQPTESTPPVEQPEAPAPGEPTPEQAPQLTNEQVQQQLDAIFRNNDVAYIVQDGDSRSQIISDFVEANKESIPGGNWVNDATGVTKGAVLADMLNDFAQQNNVELPTLHPDDEITPASLLELNLTEDQMRVIAEAMTTENVDQYLNDVQPRYELVKDGQPLPPLEPEPAPEPITVPAEFPAELQDEFITFDHVAVAGDTQSEVISGFVDENAAQIPGGNWANEANGESKGQLFADLYRTFQMRHGLTPDSISIGEHITFADWNTFTPAEQQVLIETLQTQNMQEYLDNVVPDYDALNSTTETQGATPETQQETPEQAAEQPAEAPQTELQDVPQLNELFSQNFTIQHPGGDLSTTLQQQLAQIDTFRNWPQQDGLNNLSAILTDMLVDNSAAHGFNVQDVPAGTYTLADLHINPAELQDLMLRTVEQNNASEYISNVRQDYENAKATWK